jgi:hypothetical protein
MMRGFPILSRASPARLVAREALMFGAIGNRLKHLPDKGWKRSLKIQSRCPAVANSSRCRMGLITS